LIFHYFGTRGDLGLSDAYPGHDSDQLHFGVHGAPNDSARLSRQRWLIMIQSVYGHGIAITDDTAHHYGQLCGRLRAQGRSPRGRAMDVMIAAAAQTLGVPLVTRNADDVDRNGVERLER
jgi:predicted nucleic acid-binding protein